MKTNKQMKIKNTKSLKWTDDLVKKFWDYQSQYPDNYFANLYGAKIVETIKPYVPQRSHILDYACGTGAIIKYLLRAGFYTTACDLSLDSVAYVQQSYVSEPLFQGAETVSKLTQNEQKFDAIIMVEFVEHVDDNVLEKTITDIRKILSQSGVVIVTTPNDENLDAEIVYCPCCDHTFHRWQHVRKWQKTTLADFFEQYGFEIIVIKETDFSLSQSKRSISYYLRCLSKIMRWRKQPHLMMVARLKSETKTCN